MSRIKPNIQAIESVEEADQALKEAALLEIELEKIDARYSKKIGQIKEDAAKAGEAIRDELKKIGDALSIFAQYNKVKMFDKKKSLGLNWGEIGFRKSTKIKTKRTTLELLKKLMGGKGIRIQEQIDKEALKEWQDERLAQVDAAKITEDNFFYEINKEQVNRELLEAAKA